MQSSLRTGYATHLQAFIEAALILIGLLAMLLLFPHGIYGDGKARFLALSELLQQHQLPTVQYSLIGPLFSAPLWLLGKRLATPATITVYFNTLLFALGLLFLYLSLRKHVPTALLRKFLLLLTVASMFPMHVTTYYGEVFTALCVAVGIVTLVFGNRLSTWAGWLALALGVANTPVSLVALFLVAIKRTFDSKRLRYILPLILAAGLILGESLLRFGHLLNNNYIQNAGYRTVMPYSGFPGFSYPFFFGLLSILFSFGKGLLFFVPGLLLPVKGSLLKHNARKMYMVYVLWLCFVVGLVLVYAPWWAWYAGLFWGPRFFLFACIPASFALAVRLHYRDSSLVIHLLTLLVLCLTFWVGLDGALYSGRSTAISICTQNFSQLEFLCHYTPEFSALWYPFVKHLLPEIPNAGYYFCYWLIALIWLSLPLLYTIIRQGATIIRPLVKIYLNFSSWRF